MSRDTGKESIIIPLSCSWLLARSFLVEVAKASGFAWTRPNHSHSGGTPCSRSFRHPKLAQPKQELTPRTSSKHVWFTCLEWKEGPSVPSNSDTRFYDEITGPNQSTIDICCAYVAMRTRNFSMPPAGPAGPAFPKQRGRAAAAGGVSWASTKQAVFLKAIVGAFNAFAAVLTVKGWIINY